MSRRTESHACCCLSYIACFLLCFTVIVSQQAIADWGPDTRLTDVEHTSFLSYWGGGKCIAVGSDGRINVVWDDRSRGNIFYKYFDGFSWSPEESVSESSGLDPCIGTGLSGIVQVSWYWFGYDSYSRRFDGSTWGPIKRVDDCLSGNAVYPSVAVDLWGNAHVVWSHGYPADRIVYRKFDGTTWSSCDPIVISTGVAQFPTIVSDDGGNLHVCWQDSRDGNMEIYYIKFNGSAWEPPQRLTNDPATSYFPCLAIGGTGNLHVVWEDSRDGNSEVYYKSYCGSWSADVRLSPADGYGSGIPKVAADGFEKAHVVWHDDRHGNGEIYYRRSVPCGTGWLTEVRLTDDPATSTHPSVAADHEGSPHVVWDDQRDGNRAVYYKTETVSPMNAVIDVDPDVLNPRSGGRWITAYIELPEGYDPEQIDLATVLLNEAVYAEAEPTSVGDYDEDGLPDRTVKFSRSEVIGILPSGEQVEVRVSGEVAGEPFAGADTIRVLRPKIKCPNGGEVLEVGTEWVIAWEAPAGYVSDNYSLYYTVDGCETWEVIAESIVSLSYSWIVPDLPSNNCLVLVEAYDREGVMGYDESDAASTICSGAGIPAVGESPTCFALYGCSPNPFAEMTVIAFDVPESATARITVCDTHGRIIKRLTNNKYDLGRHEVIWQGVDDAGNRVSPGIYFVRMEAGEFSDTRKMMFLR